MCTRSAPGCSKACSVIGEATPEPLPGPRMWAPRLGGARVGAAAGVLETVEVGDALGAGAVAVRVAVAAGVSGAAGGAQATRAQAIRLTTTKMRRTRTSGERGPHFELVLGALDDL